MPTLNTIYCGRNIPGTEDRVTLEEFHCLLQTFCDCATIIYAKGLWNGAYEDTFIVSLVETDTNILKDFAVAYKSEFNQEAVLFTSQAANAFFI